MLVTLCSTWETVQKDKGENESWEQASGHRLETCGGCGAKPPVIHTLAWKSEFQIS